MTAALTSALEIGQLPGFDLVTVDYEADLAALKAGVRERMVAYGFDLASLALESEPMTALLEEVAFRRTVAKQALNDAGRRMTVAFGDGAALDHLAATYYADVGVRRLDGEDDERFRRRILLAAFARTAGTLKGYEFAALTAAPDLADVRALNYASGLFTPGEVGVILLGRSGASADGMAAAVEAVRVALLHPQVKHATDTLVVRAAALRQVDVVATLHLVPGPDPTAVLAAAEASLRRFAAARRRVGRAWPLSAIFAALTVTGVEAVELQTPAADEIAAPDAALELGAVSLTLGGGHG